jgi:hypothetical protein
MYGQQLEPGSLAPLSALQRQTHLHITASRKELQHLKLPQLQQLEIEVNEERRRLQSQLLQLSHMASVTLLSISDRRGVPLPNDQLPPNVCDLTWRNYNDSYQGLEDSRSRIASECSLRPLLALRRLRRLQLGFLRGTTAAGHLVGLNAISTLTEVVLQYNWEGRFSAPEYSDAAEAAAQAAAPAAAAAWRQLLPLRQLRWKGMGLPTAVLQHVGELQGLTCLGLQFSYAPDVLQQLQPPRLAAVLQRLTNLRRLQLSLRRWDLDEWKRGGVPAASGQADDKRGVTALLQAVGGMSELYQVCINLPLNLAPAEAEQLSGTLQQVLPAWLVDHCKVTARLLSINDYQGFVDIA